MTTTEHDPTEPIAQRKNPIFEVALTVGAICGVVCIVAALSPVFFGITPLVFRSGSMAPTIDTGSLALGRTVSGNDLKVGDIVTVDRSDGSRITHRIVEIDSVVGNSATTVLKGDANTDPDAEPYVVADATRIVAHVPYAGYFVAWLGTPYAWVTGLLCAAVLIYVVFRPRARVAPHGRHSKREGRTGVASVVMVLTVATVVGTGFSRSEITAAALTDTAYGNAAVTAATLTRPTSFTCTTGTPARANLSWPAVNATYGYRLVFVGVTTVTADIGPQTAGTAVSAFPPAAVSASGGVYTVSLYSLVGENFVSTPPLTRQILPGFGLSSCYPTGGTTTSSTARSARIADTSTTPATTTTTPTSTTTELTTTTTDPSSTKTTTTEPTTTITITPPPTTTSTPPAEVPPPTTTPPPTITETPTTPPPATAFVPDGASASAGGNTASVSDGELTVTDGTTTTPYTRPITITERYGTGVVWGSDGSLYVLSGVPTVTRISPSDVGSFTSTSVSVDLLPPDIAALL